ncbi:MAG: GDP-mannose mannosyl hydrolase [Alteromonadaceae bacterium]|nr:GDP-mannose mannosyl hydrolase [Alteromonadaceae bacterium]
MFLTDDVFKSVISSTPLISIDLIVENENQQILVGYRNNRPAKGYWFVPGGRVQKGESLDLAFSRLTEVELGFKQERTDASFMGVYEHFYDDYAYGAEQSTHYVVLGYKLRANVDIFDLPKEQHNQYKWLNKDEILNQNDVHLHTKWYLDPNLKL